jgi:hypothetical protein
LSTERLREKHDLYWVAMITTAKVSNFELAGLPESCVIRVSRLTTLSDRQIVCRLGSIPPKQRNAVQALLRKYAP